MDVPALLGLMVSVFTALANALALMVIGYTSATEEVRSIRLNTTGPLRQEVL